MVGDEYGEGLGSDWRETEWRKPNPREAREYGAAQMYGHGKAGFWSTTSDHLGESMGIGMGLYFKMSWHLFSLFALMALYAIPALIMNYQGHGMSPRDMDSLGFGRFSLGNQGLNEDLIGTGPGMVGTCQADGGTLDCADPCRTAPSCPGGDCWVNCQGETFKCVNCFPSP